MSCSSLCQGFSCSVCVAVLWSAFHKLQVVQMKNAARQFFKRSGLSNMCNVSPCWCFSTLVPVFTCSANPTHVRVDWWKYQSNWSHCKKMTLCFQTKKDWKSNYLFKDKSISTAQLHCLESINWTFIWASRITIKNDRGFQLEQMKLQV